MKKLQKTIFILSLLFLSQMTFAQNTFQDINVVFNNDVENSELLIIDGMGYIRVDKVAFYLNAPIRWFQISKKVVLTFGRKEITFFEDKTTVFIGNDEKPMNKKSMVVNGKFYIPLAVILTKSFQDAADHDIEWNYNEKMLVIAKKGMTVHLTVPSAENDVSSGTNISTGNAVIPAVVSTQSVEPVVLSGSGKPVNKPNNVTAIDLIVVDAGHGDKDPGAIGCDGTKEKDLNLKVAKLTAEVLKDEYHKKVILTRDDDTFIPLRGRPGIANDNNADLFVSIHSNWSPNPKVRGFEIYFLSETASDTEAEKVAQLENAASKYEDEPEGDVNTILWSMTLNEFINESSEFCYFVKKEVGDDISFPNKGVKQAGFAVLKGSRMPSVLVEMGYMSNKEDMKLLNTSKFQKKMAHSIAEAIIDYEEHRKNK
jgi:N-acetylmuramoyl-L-alanine amidase